MPLLKTTLFTMKVPRVDLLVQYKSEYNKLSCSLDQQPLAPDHDLVLMKFLYYIFLFFSYTYYLFFAYRTIRFGIEGHCIFSGSHESLKVHTWEPPQIRDTLMMGWGKIKDISIASTQLVSLNIIFFFPEIISYSGIITWKI